MADQQTIPTIPVIPIIPSGLHNDFGEFRKCRIDSIKSVSFVIMFADYISRIMLDYQQKRAANILSLNLIHHTPSKLKEESIAVCTERYQRKDERTLRAFFGQEADMESYLRTIKRCDTDKFRPLVNFLNKRTGTTEDKNIELLAWLIDFEDRPYELGRRYDSNTPEESGIKKEESQTGNEIKEEALTEKPGQTEGKTIPDQISSRQPVSNIKTRRITLLAILLLAVFSIRIYWLGHNKTSGTAMPGDGKCMYWASDHYQQIPCDQKPDNTTQVIALDSEKLFHFKRITKPDTITQESIGTVWYVKTNGSIEYYTSDGYHPIHPELRLKPLTGYMIRMHIHPVQEIEQASK